MQKAGVQIYTASEKRSRTFDVWAIRLTQVRWCLTEPQDGTDFRLRPQA
jgi:hypothetical protein